MLCRIYYTLSTINQNYNVWRSQNSIICFPLFVCVCVSSWLISLWSIQSVNLCPSPHLFTIRVVPVKAYKCRDILPCQHLQGVIVQIHNVVIRCLTMHHGRNPPKSVDGSEASCRFNCDIARETSCIENFRGNTGNKDLNSTYQSHKKNGFSQWYCWWKKSCTSWFAKYPNIYKVLYIPGGCWGFFPSTVWQWIDKFSNLNRDCGRFSINPRFGSVVAHKNRVVPRVKHVCFLLAFLLSIVSPKETGSCTWASKANNGRSFKAIIPRNEKKTAEPSSETATAEKDDSGNILAFMFSFRSVLCWGGMLQNAIPRGFLMMRPICRPHKKEETKYVYIQ